MGYERIMLTRPILGYMTLCCATPCVLVYCCLQSSFGGRCKLLLHAYIHYKPYIFILISYNILDATVPCLIHARTRGSVAIPRVPITRCSLSMPTLQMIYMLRDWLWNQSAYHLSWIGVVSLSLPAACAPVLCLPYLPSCPDDANQN